MSLTDTAIVLLVRYIQLSMQLVFNPPMPPHRLPKFFRLHLPAQDVITNLIRHPTIPFRLIDHHTDCLQYRLPLIQATWISCQIASGLPWHPSRDPAPFQTACLFPFSCPPQLSFANFTFDQLLVSVHVDTGGFVLLPKTL